MKRSLLIGAATLALPLLAFAGPKDEARKHIQKATDAHAQGKYDVALSELDAAYALDPQPDLLYAIGQVQVKLGHCPEAIASYEKFLATNPAAEPTAAAKEAIDTCKAQAKPEPPPEPPPEPKPAPPPPPAPEPKPFYMDFIGDGLVGVGVASAVVGGIMYAGALGSLDKADAATTYAEHEKLVGDANGKRNLALVFGGVAVVAVGIGVWHFTSFHAEQSKVAFVPTTSGGMLAWMGRF